MPNRSQKEPRSPTPVLDEKKGLSLWTAVTNGLSPSWPKELIRIILDLLSLQFNRSKRVMDGFDRSMHHRLLSDWFVSPTTNVYIYPGDSQYYNSSTLIDVKKEWAQLEQKSAYRPSSPYNHQLLAAKIRPGDLNRYKDQIGISLPTESLADAPISAPVVLLTKRPGDLAQ